MSKMPHGWHLLCDNGDAELAGEIAEYMFCWSQNSTALLQRRYAADDMLHRFVMMMQSQQHAIGHLMRQQQMLGNWLVGF